jgi:hypothetical protein
MSMYEMVFQDPNRERRAAVLLAILGNPDVGRLRDAWVEKGERGPVIAVYTRNGGGNRDHYGDGPAGIGCDCTGCIATYQLPAHSQYIRDADDEFDATYATFYFWPPEDRKVLDLLTAVAVDPVDTSQRWKQVIDAIQDGS